MPTKSIRERWVQREPGTKAGAKSRPGRGGEVSSADRVDGIPMADYEHDLDEAAAWTRLSVPSFDVTGPARLSASTMMRADGVEAGCYRALLEWLEPRAPLPRESLLGT